MNKLVEPRPFANPEAAARKLLRRTGNAVELVQGRIYIEEDQRAVPVRAQGHACGIQTGLHFAIAKGWLVLHESGTFVKFTEAGAMLFA